MPCMFLFLHEICYTYEKLNDCRNLSNCGMLQELFKSIEDLYYNPKGLHL